MVGLAHALRTRGLTVAVFKCGPDYLDPTYHRRVAGRVCHNLDGWMMGRQAVLDTFERGSRGADIALIEGVMGLFDGASPTGEEGSTAEIAKWLGAPVVLVVDVSGMARTIAAVAHGFASFDRNLAVAGLVCNRVGSRGHLSLLQQTVCAAPIFGGFPKAPNETFPTRHLGLHAANEGVSNDLLSGWGQRAEDWFDIDMMLRSATDAVAGASTVTPALASEAREDLSKRPTCRIGLAWDDAFSFYYEDNLARLESLGVELVRFSPLSDRELPDVDGLYLGGGYPEVFARRLSENRSMRASIEMFAASGGPVYAECGGLMYLTRMIVDFSGSRFPMVGLIPAEAILSEKRRALGYVEVETQADSLLGPAGIRFRGHEYRYSSLSEIDGDRMNLYRIKKRRGGTVTWEGYQVDNVVATYVHAHWASNPEVAENFVEACRDFLNRECVL